MSEIKKWFSILVLLVGFHATRAQIDIVLLDSGRIAGRYPSEPSVAINPRNTDNIVAGAILDRTYTTFDAGETWVKGRLESEYGVYGDPVVAVDRKGTFYYFHLSDPDRGQGGFEGRMLDRIVAQRSSDGGRSWKETGFMGEYHPRDQDKEWVVTDQKGNLYATWTQFDAYGSKEEEDRSNILFSSSGNGKKWSDILTLNRFSGDCLDGDQTTMGGMPAVSLDGRIYVTWAWDEKIWLDRSFNGGKIWLRNDIEILDQPGGWDMRIPGLQRANGLPVIDIDRNPKNPRVGRIYINWSDQRNGENDTDIWIAWSDSRGDQFFQPIRVNDDEPGRHQFMSWMAVDPVTSNIYVIFYDRRNHDDTSTDVYLAFSTDQGQTFTNRKISQQPFVPSESVFLGDYTNIDAYDGRIAAVWTRVDGAVTSIMMAVLDHEDLEPAE